MSSGRKPGENFLALGAVYHKLLLVFRFIVQVVSVHRSKVLVCRHGGGTLPRKHIERTLVRLYSWVQAAQVKAIESAVNEGRRNAFLSILGRLG